MDDTKKDFSLETPSIILAIRKMRSLLTRREKWQWVQIVLFAMLSSMFEIVTAVTVVLLAQVLNKPEQGAKFLKWVGFQYHGTEYLLVFWAAVACGVIYLIKTVVAAKEVFYQNRKIQEMKAHFKERLLYRYADIDYKFYLTRNATYGVSVLVEDVMQVFSVGMVALAIVVSETTIFVALLCLVVVIDPMLVGIIFMVGGMFAFIIGRWVLPLFYHWGKHLQDSILYNRKNLLQFFHGFKEIILLGKRDTFIQECQQFSAREAEIQGVQMAANALPRLCIEALFILMFVIAITYMCFQEALPSEMIAILGGYLYTGFRLMPGLNRIITQLNQFKLTIPNIQRLYEEYHVVTDKEKLIDEPHFKFDHTIVLQNISFRYLNTQQDILKNIDLVIQKGEKLGIVGETGSGKSTLVDIILGLLKPHEGNILVDNQFSVQSLQWHQKIGYVPQSIYLIDDTVMANVAFGENPLEINRARLEKAIDAAQLRRWVDKLDKGLETIVGERGVRLSGGERQRIAIARALYREPEVLIFDEATSALDQETEAQLMETIDVVSEHRTVIMIAHRLTTLRSCDRIVEIQAGKVAKIIQYQELQGSLQG